MGRPPSFDERRVLKGAMHAFWRQGYHATSLKDLEQATGLTTGSLYNAFHSKDQLFAAALSHYIENIIRWRIDHYLGDSSPALEGIRQFLRSTVIGVPEAQQGLACLLVNTAVELGRTNALAGPLIEHGLGQIRDGFAAQLERARTAGEIRPDVDCAVAACQLTLLLSGLLVASRTAADSQTLAACIDMTLAALRPSRGS